MRKFMIIALILLVLAGCSPGKALPAGETPVKPAGEESSEASVVSLPEDIAGQKIVVTGDALEKEVSFSLEELVKLPGALSEGVYSVVNNWPTAKFCAARGIKLSAILEAAGAMEGVQTITVRSNDGYEQSFTREQLLGERFYYPGLMEAKDEGAKSSDTIIAFAYSEGSEDVLAAEFTNPILVIGQANISDHNNPAFVEQVTEIEVSSKEAESWEKATTFPAPGKIALFEKIKLQHKSFGLVKLHYTLDGSEPTELSPMYNPSTYRPELNEPIEITGDTVIKVLVTGFGRKNSEVATFEFTAED